MIYDHFRVPGAHDTVSDYADLFSGTLHDDKIQEFDTRWDEVPLSMSKIPSDDILESLHKLRMRESRQLKTVVELYDMEIHQKISMRSKQKLKTMVKRSIDHKLRLRNFDARHGRKETGAVVTNRRSQRGLERGQGVCDQWKAKGHQEVEGRREKGASEAGVRLGRPIDSRAKTSCRVFALNYLVTIGILPNFSFISQNRLKIRQ